MFQNYGHLSCAQDNVVCTQHVGEIVSAISIGASSKCDSCKPILLIALLLQHLRMSG